MAHTPLLPIPAPAAPAEDLTSSDMLRWWANEQRLARVQAADQRLRACIAGSLANLPLN